MTLDPEERGRWLGRNVLPHEGLLRAKLRQLRIPNLEIEDILQETYTRILQTASLESIRYPKQYAVVTAKAVVFDHIRHSRVVSIAFCGSLENFDLIEPDANAEERLEFQDEVLAVADALAKLPRMCREVIIMRRVDGLPQREVAGRLGISEKTVEKYVSDGSRLLLKLFGRGGKSRSRTSDTKDTGLSRNGDHKLRD